MCGKNPRRFVRPPERNKRGYFVTEHGTGQKQSVRACSACRGDYEDPDRTAWPSEEEQPAWDDDPGERAGDDEFPGELLPKTD